MSQKPVISLASAFAEQVLSNPAGIALKPAIQTSLAWVLTRDSYQTTSQARDHSLDRRGGQSGGGLRGPVVVEAGEGRPSPPLCLKGTGNSSSILNGFSFPIGDFFSAQILLLDRF